MLTMKTRLFATSAGLLTLGVLGNIACSSTTTPAPLGNDNSDISYDPHGSTIFSPRGLPGDPTDEDVDALLEATPKTGEGAVFAAPAGGATLPAATPFPFTWTYAKDVQVDAGTDSATDSGEIDSGGLDDGAVGSLAPSLRPRVAPTTFADLLGGERSAFAHGSPFTGTLHLVTFTTAKNAKLLRVATAKTTFTPDDFRWKKLTDAGEAIEAHVLSGHFNVDVLDDGPYVGPSITFTVK
jgi:hypothetical protein